MTTKTSFGKNLRNAALGLASLAIIGSANAASSDTIKVAGAVSGTDTVKSENYNQRFSTNPFTGYIPSIEASLLSTSDNGQKNKVLGSGLEAIANVGIYHQGVHQEILKGNVKNDFTSYSEKYISDGAEIATYNGFTNKLSGYIVYNISDKLPLTAGIEAENNSVNVSVNGLDAQIKHSESFVGPVLGLGYRVAWGKEGENLNCSRNIITPYVKGAVKLGSVNDSINGVSNTSDASSFETDIGMKYTFEPSVVEEDYKSTKDWDATLNYNQRTDRTNGTTKRSTLSLDVSKNFAKFFKFIFKMKNSKAESDNSALEQTQINLGVSYTLKK